LECQLRRQISHQLHDGPLQLVVGSKLLMEALAAKLEAQGTGDSVEYQAVIDLLQRAITDTRNILFQFRPLSFVSTGSSWTDALRCWLEQLPGVSSKIRLAIGDDAVTLPDYYQESLYRFVREGIQNALQHGRPSEISLSVERVLAGLSIELVDNGRGFDPAQVPADHFGLLGMRERITDLGGTLQIISSKGSGTRILASVPLPSTSAEN
jgi:signal transduction histidine kinase